MTALRRLLAVLLHRACGDPPARIGESAARLTLYSTSKRGVQVTPANKSARVADTTGRATHKETRNPHGQHAA